jgi:hypothetical protein
MRGRAQAKALLFVEPLVKHDKRRTFTIDKHQSIAAKRKVSFSSLQLQVLQEAFPA